ncbi:hypothetical protein D9M70_601400 [compost metagenome]
MMPRSPATTIRLPAWLAANMIAPVAFSDFIAGRLNRSTSAVAGHTSSISAHPDSNTATCRHQTGPRVVLDIDPPLESEGKRRLAVASDSKPDAVG